MARKGTVNQLRGPFTASEDILAKMGIEPGFRIKFGISVEPKVSMKYPGLGFYIDGGFIAIGNSGIYEMTEPTIITSFISAADTPAGVLIDFVVCD